MWDGTGKLPIPDSHVDNEDGTKTMVYNKERKKKERRIERLKKYNSRKKGKILNH